GADELAVGVEAVAGGVGLHGDGLVEQGEADAGLAGRLGGGAGQGGDGGGPGGQVGVDVGAAGRGEGGGVGGRIEHAAQVVPAAGGQGGDVDVVAGGLAGAPSAEAQAEQEPGDLAEVLQAALVVVAVGRALVVQGLGAQHRDRVAAQVPGHGEHVVADGRAGRAQAAGETVTEVVLLYPGGAVVQVIAVQQDGPGRDLDAERGGRPAGLGEDVPASRGRADRGAQRAGADGRVHGVERTRSQRGDPVGGVVRVDVARGVVAGRDGDAGHARAVADGADDAVGPLAEQVSGQAVDRTVHGAPP